MTTRWQNEPTLPAIHGSASSAAMSTSGSAGQRVVLRKREPDLVLEQVGALERGVAGRGRERVLLGEHEVELAELELGQAVLGLEVARGHAQVGVLGGERGDRPREQRAVRAGEGSGAEHARDLGGRALDRRLGGLELAQDALGARDELLAGRREPAAAAVALEQLDAGLALECRELLGDGRSGVAERVGGGGDRPAGGELAQDAQAADVEHCES